MLNTLSGRFLLLTTLFVMLAEVLIFVPSVARFREDYLLSRLERAQIAALALLAGDDMIEPEVEEELLRTAGVFNVVLRRDELRQLDAVLRDPRAHPRHLRPARPVLVRADRRRHGAPDRPRGSRDPRHRRPGARGGALDRDHHTLGSPARGHDRLRAADPGPLGDHLHRHGAAAVSRGAAVHRDAHPGRRGRHGALRRRARGRAQHHGPHRRLCASCARRRRRSSPCRPSSPARSSKRSGSRSSARRWPRSATTCATS